MKVLQPLRLSVLLIILSLVLPASLMAQAQIEEKPLETATRASYHDFDDIIIPSELKLDKKNSMVYSTAQAKVGILIFHGRVEPISLVTFFQNNMQKDGWRQLSVFKYRDYMLSFLKENRSCVISIREKTFKTTVEVRVGPIEPAFVQGKENPSP